MQKKVKKIYEYSFWYFLISRVTFLFMRIYYKKVYVRGQENVPAEGPVIFAPNHKNALMDPLLILYSFPNEQVVFMARGDFFVNKTVAGILRFFKILPVFRMRNGIGNLSKNEEPFDEAIDTLKNDRKLCLMPEGQQVEVRKLLPLVKGMFRIGFHAQEKFGKEPGVKIIPVGIEYEDLCFSGHNTMIQYGKPIELADYYDLYTENQPQAYNALRDNLSPCIRELMLDVPSNEHYDAIYLAILLNVDTYLKEHGMPDDEWNRLEAKQQLALQYNEEEKTNPEKIQLLHQQMQKLYATGKSADEISRLMKPTTATDWVKIILLFPVFLTGAFCMLLPYCVIKYITQNLLDSGFYSSLTFVLGIFLPAVFFVIYFFVGALWMPFSYSALMFFVIVPVISIIAFRLKELYFDVFRKIKFKRKIKDN